MSFRLEEAHLDALDAYQEAQGQGSRTAALRHLIESHAMVPWQAQLARGEAAVEVIATEHPEEGELARAALAAIQDYQATQEYDSLCDAMTALTDLTDDVQGPRLRLPGEPAHYTSVRAWDAVDQIADLLKSVAASNEEHITALFQCFPTWTPKVGRVSPDGNYTNLVGETLHLDAAGRWIYGSLGRKSPGGDVVSAAFAARWLTNAGYDLRHVEGL